MKHLKLLLIAILFLNIFNLKSQTYTPEICEALIDEVTGVNIVLWELPDSIGLGNGHFNIYANEGAENNYIKIGEVPNNQDYYVDFASSPSDHLERYKLSYTNENTGVESELSLFHQSVTLSVSKGVVPSNAILHWNSYLGREVNVYEIYRGTEATNLYLYYTVNAVVHDFIDNDGSTPHFYAVKAIFENECGEGTITGYQAFYSPQKKADDDIKFYTNLYPNPANNNNEITLDYYNPDNFEFEVNVLNIFGETVEKHSTNENIVKFDITNFSKGIYFIELKGFYNKSEKFIIN